MSDAETTPTPPETNAAAPLPATPVTQRAATIAPSENRFNPLRPFGYFSAFCTGSVLGALRGLSTGAHHGLWMGAFIGAGLCATGFFAALIPAIVGSAAIGAVAGMAIEGGLGLIIGGMKEVQTLQRKEKYADELLEKKTAHAKIKHPPVQHKIIEKREKESLRRQESLYNFDTLQAKNRENESDTRNYWQSHVSDTAPQSWDKGL